MNSNNNTVCASRSPTSLCATVKTRYSSEENNFFREKMLHFNLGVKGSSSKHTVKRSENLTNKMISKGIIIIIYILYKTPRVRVHVQEEK